jgi:putative tricarboxylic transport membrane protein
MSGDRNSAAKGPLQRNIEIALAFLIAVFGLIIIGGALKSGIGWGFDGPRAGFFPFYIGTLVVIAAVVTLYQEIANTGSKKVFAEWDQLKQVLSVAVPTLVYIIAIAFLGIYVSSAVLIAYFMMVISSFGIVRTALIAILVPIITFVVFEKWFLVALPKGPLERMLGY